MKKLFSLLLIITAIFACGENNSEIPMVDKLTPLNEVFTYESLTDVGFKKVKSYKVNDLPNSDSAYFGWKQVGTEGKKDFEIRIYNSHQDAINHGTLYADEATGKDAVITKKDATWKEGIKDRRLISTPSDGGAIGAAIGSKSSPKYADYIIYGNLIILCEGWDSEESFSRCSDFVINLGKSQNLQ
mgnify:CR=1 FL=1